MESLYCIFLTALLTLLMLFPIKYVQAEVTNEFSDKKFEIKNGGEC